MQSYIKQILCPVCGRTILENYRPVININGRKYRDLDSTVNYLGQLKRNYDMNRSYFAIIRGTGYGGLAKNKPISPSEWEDGFEAIKRALIRGVAWYIKQGWFSKEELLDGIERAVETKG